MGIHGNHGKVFRKVVDETQVHFAETKPEVQDFAASRGRTLWRGQQETL